MRLLLVEDEVSLADLVAARLRTDRFLVDHVTTLGDAELMLEVAAYDLVILDRRLPDGDGLRVVPTVRRRQPGVPVLVLTARDAVSDRVSGLDAGADDYLTKPFDMSELLARVRAGLRRRGGMSDQPLTCGRLSFDPAHREASVAGEPLKLASRELALLELLIGRAGRVVQRDVLDRRLYGLDDDIQSNALDVQVSRLRRRLQLLDAQVGIHTVRGVGYMLRPE